MCVFNHGFLCEKSMSVYVGNVCLSTVCVCYGRFLCKEKGCVHACAYVCVSVWALGGDLADRLRAAC